MQLLKEGKQITLIQGEKEAGGQKCLLGQAQSMNEVYIQVKQLRHTRDNTRQLQDESVTFKALDQLSRLSQLYDTPPDESFYNELVPEVKEAYIKGLAARLEAFKSDLTQAPVDTGKVERIQSAINRLSLVSGHTLKGRARQKSTHYPNRTDIANAVDMLHSRNKIDDPSRKTVATENLSEEPPKKPSHENIPLPKESPKTGFKPDEEIRVIFASSSQNRNVGETELLKARLREVIRTHYGDTNNENQVELLSKIYNIIKHSYKDVIYNPKQNVLQRTDKFVCLEDEDIERLKTEMAKTNTAFTVQNSWRQLLWLAFANLESTPIPGMMIRANMYELTPSEMSKLFLLALEVANRN
ncbi:MAG: hypothetical protein JSR37_01945 [Verrucomicrobia bacterium]|nr:hypothetical protein [Verrucomicrobiota bacterium]